MSADSFTPCERFRTFPLDGGAEEAGAFVDVVRPLIKLQGRLVLRVVDVDDGARVCAQQRVRGHAQLHVEALDPLEHLVVVDHYGAHLGVLALVELDLENPEEEVVQRTEKRLCGLPSKRYLSGVLHVVLLVGPSAGAAGGNGAALFGAAEHDGVLIEVTGSLHGHSHSSGLLAHVVAGE